MEIAADVQRYFSYWRPELNVAERTLRQQLTFYLSQGLMIYAYVLHRGILCRPAALPSSVRRGPKQQCFRNAAELAQGRPDQYVYVEGYAHSVRAIPHAWCITRDGTVVDPTWDHPEHCAYIGIPVAEDFLQLTVLKQQTWSIFGETPRRRLLVTPITEMVHPWWHGEIVVRPKWTELNIALGAA